MSAYNEGLMTGASLGQGAYRAQGDRRVGGLMSAGNYEGAATAAFEGGDLRSGQAIQERLSDEQKAAAEERVTVLSRGVAALRGVPADQRPQALQQMLPMLGQVFDPESLQGLASADLSDQSLNAFGQMLGQEAQRLQLFQTRDGDIVGVNPQTGENSMVYDGPERQDAPPQGYRWTDGGGLVAIPGGPADTSVVQARAAAGRAPPRARSSGGGSRSGGNRSSGAAPASSSRPWERY